MKEAALFCFICLAGKTADELWQEHISDKAALHTYSSAMSRLATGPWACRKEGGRIEWCVTTCLKYFSSRLEQLLLKDLRRQSHGMPTLVPTSLLPASPEAVREKVAVLKERKWRLLDVGSCYNPFQEWLQLFDVTAIDIAPASPVSAAICCVE